MQAESTLWPKRLKIILWLALVVMNTRTMADEDLWLDSFDAAPAVHIAHIAQNIRDTSASVSRITREDIQQWQFRDWYDVLRTIPGMTVVKKSAPLSSIDYGSNGTRLGSGLEILVNGIRQTIPAQSSAFIELLPPLEMVDSIEIVRGSNAASDGGSVSFKGTIHITTRNPKYQDTSLLKTELSSHDEYRTVGYHTTELNNHHFSLAMQYIQDDGFDSRDKLEKTDSPPIANNIKDDLKVSQLHLQHSHEPNAETSISSSVFLLDSKLHIPGTTLVKDRVPDSNPADTEHYAMTFSIEQWLSEKQRINVSLSHQDWRWNQQAELCGPTVLLSPEAQAFIDAYPEYLPNLVMLDLEDIPVNTELLALFTAYLSDPSSICTLRPQIYELDRSRLQARHLIQWDSLHWIVGIDLSSTTVNGELFDDSNRYNNSQLFSHLQWLLHRQLTFNIGARLEDFNDEQGLSSRLGLNYHINSQQTLRLVTSYSEKLPDIADIDDDFKQLAVISETDVYGSRFHQVYDGSQLGTNKEAQIIRGLEVGFFWQYAYRHHVDFRLFHDQMQNISNYDINLIFVPPAEDMKKTGLEMQMSGQWLNLQYGFSLHYHDSNSSYEAENYDRHGINLVGSYPLTDATSLVANAYYSRTALTLMNRDIDEPIGIYSMGIKQQWNKHLAMSLVARHDMSYYTTQIYLPEINKGNYDNRNSIIYTLEYTF